MRGTPGASAPAVTVVLPVFGNHRAAQTLPAVCAAWLAQDVPCEVVVAAAGGVTVPDGVRTVDCDPDACSPGPLRNVAAAAARAPVLYLGDADVVPLGRDFLSRALRLCGGSGVVVQPWMYRLVDADDLVGVSEWHQPGRGRVCHVRGGRDGRLAPVPGEVFRWDDDVLLVDPPPAAGYPGDSPQLRLRAPFHWGGTLVRRHLFDAVGGYYERYAGWGCEDDDLHAKLAGRSGPAGQPGPPPDPPRGRPGRDDRAGPPGGRGPRGGGPRRRRLGRTPMPEAIVVKELCKRYGDTRAVDGVSLDVETGEFFGILGPNGAGKTTTL